MSKQFLFSLLVETGMIVLTTLLLAQPKPFFSFTTEKGRALATMSGLFVLCLTFCWSVIFGCVLALHQMTYRI